MDNKLAVVERKEDIILTLPTSRVKIRKSRRKKKSHAKHLLIFIMLLGVFYFCIQYFSEITALFTPSLPIENELSVPPQSSFVNASKDDTPPKADNESSTIGNFVKYANSQQFINESHHLIDSAILNCELPTASQIQDTYGADAPVVLITSFSPTECYFNSSPSYHSEQNNVSDIAKKICEHLIDNGINAIHLTIPYGNSASGNQGINFESEVSSILLANPSISYVFDISRSILIDESSQPFAEMVNLNGKSIPTVRLTYGTEKNLSSSAKKAISVGNKLSKEMNSSACFLSCETVSKYHLFQRFNVPCLRVDIGSYMCSFADAVLSAEYFSQCVCSVLQ